MPQEVVIVDYKRGHRLSFVKSGDTIRGRARFEKIEPQERPNQEEIRVLYAEEEEGQTNAN
jgi:hypothetical protein